MAVATQSDPDFRGDRLSVRMFGARGNGSASDTAALQAAITTCEQDGLALYIPHGTYILDAPITAAAPVTIFGAGRQSIFKLAAGIGEDFGALFLIESDEVVFEDLFVDGQGDSQTERSVIFGFGADTARVRIAGVHFQKTFGYGIQCTGYAPTDLTIEKCTFTDHKGPGYAISVDSGSTRLRIVGNVVNGVTDTAGGNGGGILVFHPSTYSNFDVLIDGNTVIDCAGVPLELQRGERAQVTNNRVSGGGANGISVGAANHLLVANNISKDQISYGYEGGAGDHQVWSGNQAIDCGIGMIFDNSGGTLRRDITVVDNIIDTTIGTGGGSGSGHGIRFFDCTEVICARNTIRDSKDAAIVALGTGSNRVSLDIADNIIHFSAARASGPVGVQLGNRTYYSRVRGNRIQVDAAADNSDLFYLGPIIITGTTNYPEIIENVICRDTEASKSPHWGISVQSGGEIVLGRISRNSIQNFNTGIRTEATTGVVDISDNDVSTCTTPYNLNANHLISGTHLFSGDVGIGISPTARLHLAAGTATAGDAPLKMTAGTLLATPEAGAAEFDGNFEYFTPGSIRYTRERILHTSFLPTGAGWYRILSGSNYVGGILRVEGFVDNYRADIEVIYGVMGYGGEGTLMLLKISNYPSLDDDLISQVRISNNNAGACYLDIYVKSSTSPSTIRAYCIGPNNNGIVAAPTIGATAGPNNVRTIVCSRFPTLTTALRMEPTTLFGSPIENLIEADGSNLYYTNNAGNRKPLGIDLTIVNNRVVQTDGAGDLVCDKVALGNSNFVELAGAAADDVLTWSGDSVAYTSMTTLATDLQTLMQDAMLTYIQANIEIGMSQVTGLETELSDLDTAIGTKADIDHGHTISTALVGTPEEHSHTLED